jgi:hypothetical protein
LLIGALRCRRRERLHPDPQPLIEGELVADGRLGRRHAGHGGASAVVGGHSELLLDSMDVREVGFAVAAQAAHDRADPGRAPDHRHPRRPLTIPARGRDQLAPGTRAGRPRAQVGKVVGPGVDELVDHIPLADVRELQQLGAGAQVELAKEETVSLLIDTKVSVGPASLVPWLKRLNAAAGKTPAPVVV